MPVRWRRFPRHQAWGQPSVNGDGTLRYSPMGVAAINSLAAGQSLSDSFVYSIADGNSGVDSATVTITLAGRNDPPLAVDDGSQTDADEVLTIDVLDNDSDPDASDTLSITNVAASSARGAAVSLNGDGTLRYDPRGSSVLGRSPRGSSLSTRSPTRCPTGMRGRRVRRRSPCWSRE